jgi:hypothetical protein
MVWFGLLFFTLSLAAESRAAKKRSIKILSKNCQTPITLFNYQILLREVLKGSK